jgi:acyl carrier protein
MDETEVKNKIKKILKDNFNINDINDESKLFHDLDSINYYRYILFIENEFSINIDQKISLKTINETYNYIKKINDNN